jgi:nucleotide-binding universal stress UspA family protein
LPLELCDLTPMTPCRPTAILIDEMTLETETPPVATGGSAPPSSIFRRVVVGVDGTEAGYEACLQAARLLEPEGTLELVSASYLAGARLPWSPTNVSDELEREAGPFLHQAQEIAGPRATGQLVNAPGTDALLEAVERVDATVVAVGTHGKSRLAELVYGSVAGAVLHEAPCSVLIVRPPAARGLFPHALVVGLDGSPESEAALLVAQELSRRFEAPLRIVIALGGSGVDLARVRLRTPFLEEIHDRPVAGLVAAAKDADLLVVGSRGLHGLRSLGSVSERVAHQASCSVLVVRPRPE